MHKYALLCIDKRIKISDRRIIMTLGIIAAMDKEAEGIISAMTGTSAEVIGSIKYTRGKIKNTDVVIAVCGIGKVFAAICAQTMIITYHPDYILNTGIAGALSRELGICDIAVATDTVQHDMDTSAIGDPVGFVSGINIIKFPASEFLSDKITEIASSFGFNTVRGTIASGDKFVADSDTKRRIVDLFGAIACEMEGGAIAHAAYINNTPYAVVRAISDNADGEADMDYPTFAALACKNSVKITVKLAEEIGG